jgi:hypothetical protein
MGENMGYGGLSILYTYFFLSGAVVGLYKLNQVDP